MGSPHGPFSQTPRRGCGGALSLRVELSFPRTGWRLTPFSVPLNCCFANWDKVSGIVAKSWKTEKAADSVAVAAQSLHW